MHHFIYKFYSLLLIFSIINNAISEFPKNNIPNRLLNEVQKKQNSENNSIPYNIENNKNETSKNPLTFLLAYYILFLLLAIYLICLLNKSRYDYVRDLTAQLYKFLYIANNGALFVTLINIVVVYENLGIGSIIIGIIIFIMGGIYYFKKLKEPKFIEECFQSETITKLFNLPCLILKLVCSTLCCCLCESSIIIEKTYIDAFGNKEVREEESCLPYIWNFFFISFKMFITIFTIIAYYIGLVLYCLFWFIAKLIYNKVNENKAQSFDINSNNQSISNTNVNNPNLKDDIITNSNKNISKPDLNNHNIEADVNKYNKIDDRTKKKLESNKDYRNNESQTMDQYQNNENLNGK